MMAADLIAARIAPLRLVIFDCDGVLVDSEPVSSRVVARELTGLGWPMTPEQADRLFLGTTITDMVPRIERQLGRALPPGWSEGLADRVAAAMREEVEAIPGAIVALEAVGALGLPWRIASNSSHAEMAAKFARIGIAGLAAGRTHSFTDVARGKPAPDLYLAAAAAEGIPPAQCLVIEDSLPGIRGAVAAGIDCLAYVPHGDGSAHIAVGAAIFRSMGELPALIAQAARVPA